MKLFEINATYGSGKTPTTLFVATERNGQSWYVCEGSTNVNATYEDITEGCDIEQLQDVDVFTANQPIMSLDELETAIDSY